MPGLRELLLLWLFMSGSLIVVSAAVVLAVGALFGVVWLSWKGCLFMAETIECWVNREPPAGKVGSDDTVTIYTRMPGPGLRGAGGRRDVRLPKRLVPAASCSAQRDLARVQRGRRRPRSH